MKKLITKIISAVFIIGILFTINIQAEIKDNVDFTYTLSVGNYIDEVDVNSTSLGIYSYCNATGSALTGTITSSDTSIVSIASSSSKINLTNSNKTTNGNFSFTAKKPGIATIKTTIGTRVYSAKIAVVPTKTNISSVTKSTYNAVSVKWNSIAGAQGYIIQRALNGGKYSNITTISGQTQNSAVVAAPWDKTYTYRVVAYIKDGSTTIVGNDSGITKTYKLQSTGTYIKSIAASGSASLKIKWNTVSGGKNYKVYRSTKENAGYKCIKTTSSSVKSFTNKVTKGVNYYYRIVTVYNNGYKYTSKTVSGIRAIKAKGSIKVQKKISLTHSTTSPYYSNWANPDKVYYYNSGSKFYAVTVSSANKLKVYTLTSSMKYKSVKQVKLSGSIFGGFYHGTDGYNYVATGYKNTKQSTSKTVIKVAKYNSSWKLVKTSNIKGKMSGDSMGIYTPFDGGNCKMDMNNGKLYMVAARIMFKQNDGIRHQSNLCVEINTSTMKATYKIDSYVSHSFNQFVKFQDNNLYIVDHGDAYPRAINLTIVSNYGTTDSNKISKQIFKIKGTTGGNYTGVTVGGMEVGSNNVVVCGTAQPHYSTVAGVTGFSTKYNKNVYVVVANKKTGASTIKWLTNYNVKQKGYAISDTRMVKVSNNRFMVMYSITIAKKTRTYYKLIDNTGKIIYTKSYTKYKFTGASQPLFYKGSVMWLEGTYNSKGDKMTTTTYKMPVKMK